MTETMIREHGNLKVSATVIDCEALTTASGGDCTQGYTGVLK